jgi:hypothetical protein
VGIVTLVALALPMHASGAGAAATSTSPDGGVAPTSGPTTVVIVGDSLAFTLAYNGLTPEMKRQIALQGAARIGCGLLTGTLLEGDREGDSQDQCGDWPQQFAAAVMTYHPNITLLLIGGWEVTDRRIGDRIYRVGTPKLEALLRDRLDLALRILTAGGARLVMLTTPCLSPAKRDLHVLGEKERAQPWRVRWLNGVWRRFARRHPTMTLLDLDAHACPHGHYADEIGGVPMRSDGVHFTDPGAQLMWRWLGPQLLDIAAGHSVPNPPLLAARSPRRHR